jgi:dihydrofolate synthase/folylpolyglutamate synthase
VTSPKAHAATTLLGEWLAILERRHPVAIDLGLERVGDVWRRLGSPGPASRVVTVGGTNGKGSVVAFLEAAARASGWRVGAYTSPHIDRYNERIRIDGADAADADIVAAFERIESARAGVSLTYFEFGTLAALLLMAQTRPALDLAVLEVGLGGRLDAVNLIDADVAVVTTVALDHQDWLGDTRAKIAVEKAGIARSGRPLVVGERSPEPALLSTATAIGARLVGIGREFDWQLEGNVRRFEMAGHRSLHLPTRLQLTAPCQWDNAATALAAFLMLAGPDWSEDSQQVVRATSEQADNEPVVPGTDAAAVRSSPDQPDVGDCRYLPSLDPVRAAAGLADARLSGRLERVAVAPDVVVDVGHNPQAAEELARWLEGDGAGIVTHAVFSALNDKDIEGIVAPLLPLIARWHVAGLDGVTPRGSSAHALGRRLLDLIASRVARERHLERDQVPMPSLSLHATVADALAAAMSQSGADERVLAFGSFHVVSEVRKALRGGL